MQTREPHACFPSEVFHKLMEAMTGKKDGHADALILVIGADQFSAELKLKESTFKEMEKPLRTLCSGKGRLDRTVPVLILVTKSDTKRTSGMSDDDFSEIKANIELDVSASFKFLIHPDPKVLNVQVCACYGEPLDAGAKESLTEGMDVFIPILATT